MQMEREEYFDVQKAYNYGFVNKIIAQNGQKNTYVNSLSALIGRQNKTLENAVLANTELTAQKAQLSAELTAQKAQFDAQITEKSKTFELLKSDFDKQKQTLMEKEYLLSRKDDTPPIPKITGSAGGENKEVNLVEFGRKIGFLK
jgi:hypothetical protein